MADVLIPMALKRLPLIENLVYFESKWSSGGISVEIDPNKNYLAYMGSISTSDSSKLLVIVQKGTVTKLGGNWNEEWNITVVGNILTFVITRARNKNAFVLEL